MKKYIQLFTLCSLLILSASCEKWLDATPSSQIEDEEQFASEAGFQQVLLGCYINMTDQTLYGRNLSWLLPDILSQTYNTFSGATGTGSLYYFQRYNYVSTNSSPVVEAIWLQGYNVLTNANKALEAVEKDRTVLHPINRRLIKGELLAIRAFIHFDLLRLYGYGNLADRTDKATKLTLPYVTKSSKEFTPQATYSDYIGYIIADLQEAVTQLEEDPIRRVHPDDYYALVNTGGFYNDRELRLNYYAAKALLARVCMWEGSGSNVELARKTALEIITDNNEKGIFSWGSASLDNNTVMSSEHLFALNVIKLKEILAPYFIPELKETEYTALYLRLENLRELYEVEAGIGGADLRFSKLYYINQQNLCTPLKISQEKNITSKISNRIPLIRLPELYYIAAEGYGSGSSADFGAAKEMLTAVRHARGVVAEFDCHNRETLIAELIKEYRKEFVAEGVLFYLYKRLGTPVITGSSGTAYEMTDATYTFPYPDSEIQQGRVQ